MNSTAPEPVPDVTHASPSGKTCQAFSANMTTRSGVSLRLSPATTSLLNRVSDPTQASRTSGGRGRKSTSAIVRSGRSQVLLLDPREQSRGSLGTLNIMDWHSDAAVCSLSQVLVRTSIPQQYFLSSTACEGILRRAEKRGKDLPTPLRRALRAVVEVSKERVTREGRTPQATTGSCPRMEWTCPACGEENVETSETQIATRACEWCDHDPKNAEDLIG